MKIAERPQLFLIARKFSGTPANGFNRPQNILIARKNI